MKPGECWTFNSFKLHEVHNRGGNHRVHLVLDTVGGDRLMDRLDALNRCPAHRAVRYASELFSDKWHMRQRRKSPAFTTDWNSLPVVWAH